MGLPPPRKQTVGSVPGFIAFAMVFFVVVSAILRHARDAPADVALSMFTGVWFAITTVATNYYRLAPNDRLPPVHAIGLGLFDLALVGIAIRIGARKAGAPPGWPVWAGAALLSVPAAYLIAAGTSHWRRTVRAAAS